MDKDVTHQQVVLHYINPCPELFRVRYDKSLRTPMYLPKLCEQQYKEEWMKSVEITKSCLGSIRSKRQLLPMLATIAMHAVTNLLSSRTMQGNRRLERNDALKSFYTNFNMQDLFNQSSGAYVSICTDLTQAHPQEYTSVSHSLPGLVWSQAKIHGKILANAANLRAIYRLCRAGHLATKELAELTGNSMLGEIDPKDTEIISVEVGSDEEFSFLLHS